MQHAEIVLQLTARSIMRGHYKDQIYTYEINVMGAVNILECVRNSTCVRTFFDCYN